MFYIFVVGFLLNLGGVLECFEIICVFVENRNLGWEICGRFGIWLI